MRLADDDRGRVPFALVGVLLLVGSATFAAGLQTAGPARTNQAADVATGRVTASLQAAVRTAVGDAAREAALHPVTTPANTSTGRVLDEERAFRDALRLRIYVRTRAALRETATRRQDVRAVATLPATPNASALDDALSRVSVRGVQNGTALRVTIRNVTVRATRDGRPLVSERRTVSVVVATPVLAVHDRTARFERRATNGPLDGPGFGRRLTRRLFAIAWARGYAQHAGAPVQNVLATRHVDVAANGALLRTQRTTFGHRDDRARRQFRRAAVRMGVADALEPAGVAASDVPTPNRTIPVTVGETADRAYLHVLDAPPTEPPSLRDALRDAYRVEGRLRTTVVPIRTERPPARVGGGPGWEHVATDTHVDARVTNASAPRPSIRDGERLVTRFARRVELVYEREWRWRKGNRTRTTSATWTEAARVGVAVVARHDPAGGAPSGTTRPLFERGGALNGSNLAGTPASVDARLVADRGGEDSVAVAVLRGDARRSVHVYGRRPANLTSWVRRDLEGQRRAIRSVGVGVTGTDLATMRTNPAAALAARLRSNRDTIVAPPSTYDGVADRARVAARAQYLDAVLARLDARSERFRRLRSAYESTLRREGLGGADELAGYAPTKREEIDVTPRVRGTLTNATLTPRASPAYLTTDRVSHAEVRAVPRRRAYHPLVTRNRNLFTVPYEDAAARVAGAAIDDPNRIPLGTAGRTLRAANRTLTATDDERLRTRRDRLSRAVGDAFVPVRRRAVADARAGDVALGDGEQARGRHRRDDVAWPGGARTRRLERVVR